MKSRLGPQWRERIRRYNSCTLNGRHYNCRMASCTEISWEPKASALQAAAGAALAEGATASASACGADSWPQGSQKTQDRVMKMDYWRGWRADAALFYRRCIQCNRYRRGPVARQGELQQATTGGPFTKIHVDLTRPHVRSKNGFVYLLTAVDYFTKYLICVQIRDKSALSVAKALVKHVYVLFGCPLLQISDMGEEFQNNVIRNIADFLVIQLNRTTAYRPSSNGAVERVHRTIDAIIAKLGTKIKGTGANWHHM